MRKRLAHLSALIVTIASLGVSPVLAQSITSEQVIDAVKKQADRPAVGNSPINLRAPCGNKVDDGTNSTRECTFDDFIRFVYKIIQFLIFQVSIPLAVLAFFILGARLVLERNKPAVFAQVKGYLMDLVWGVFLVVAAYSIVSFIYSQLAAPYNAYFK